jgi:hypothetical protein
LLDFGHNMLFLSIGDFWDKLIDFNTSIKKTDLNGTHDTWLVFLANFLLIKIAHSINIPQNTPSRD